MRGADWSWRPTSSSPNVNTERLYFGKLSYWAAFLHKTTKQHPESQKCSHELQANMAGYPLCVLNILDGAEVGRPVGFLILFSTETSWGVPACVAWSPQTRHGQPPPEDQECEKTAGCSLKNNRAKEEGGKEGRAGGKKPGGAQWVLPSSKDSTPESQVLAASFSCRLLMISWSSEPELLWKQKERRKRSGGRQRKKEQKQREETKQRRKHK